MVPESVGRARLLLDELRGEAEPGVIEGLRLVVSELVTNALKHSGIGPWERVLVRLVSSSGLIRGEVEDPDPGFDGAPVAMPRPDQPDGRGLLLADGLVNRWGVTRGGPSGERSLVWFKLDHGGCLRWVGTRRGERRVMRPA